MTYKNALPDRWSASELRSLVKKDRPISYGIVQTGEPIVGGIPCVRVVDLGKFQLSPVGMITTSQMISNSYRRTILQKGDLIFALRGEIGKVAVVGEELVGANLTRGVALISPAEYIDSEFLSYAIQSPEVKRRIELSVNGSALREIPIAGLRKIIVPVPPRTEQRKIASVISAWDRALQEQHHLVLAKKRLKRGLMQEILSGKKRFQEFANQTWQRMKISNFANYKPRIKVKPDKPFTALGIRSHGKGTFLKPNFDPAKIEMDKLFEVKENDLILNITFAWEGAIAIAGASDEGALVSHRFPTYEFKTDVVIPEFFRHVIIQKMFINGLGIISPGGAGRNRVLSKRDFGNLQVLVPSVEEQRRIGSVLNACDREIGLLTKQHEALKLQKRGLMQKLLTGQIRVKARDENKEELVSE